MVPAVRSTLDVALWMLTRAESAEERLQPQKLQRLLYPRPGPLRLELARREADAGDISRD